MTRKKILMIAPDLGYGGAEKSFSRWADILAQDHDVTRVVFNTSSGKNTYLSNGNFISLDIPASKNVFSKLINFFKRVSRLKKLKTELKIEVSISFLEGADYVNILSKTSDKVVLSIRGSKYYDSNISGMLGWLRQKVLIPYLYNRADRIAVVSEGIKKELEEFYGIKKTLPIDVIYNFYDPDELKALARQEIPLHWGEFLKMNEVLICVGRLALQKGYAFMIRVFKKMKTSRPDLKLLIVGDGPLQQDLETLAKVTGLSVYLPADEITSEGDIYFAGMISNPHAYVSRAKLFVLPSHFEGFPNALAEAMVCNVPVAAANCPYGPAEIFGQPIEVIRHAKFLDCGLLLPTGSEVPDENLENEWANALLKALDDKVWRERSLNESNKRILNFTIQRFKNTWKELLG